MARRAIWKGAISFGMVAIPVKVYNATDSKDIAFVTLHAPCGSRIRQRHYCPHHEAIVDQSEEVRAYEYAKEQYVVMETADFDDLPVPSKHTIEISQFVQLEAIDPMYYDRSYALEPEGVGVKPFYLLKKALESTDRVAIAKVSLRQKEHLCCLRPYEHGLLLETMHYPDEIRGTSELNLPEEQASLSDAEVNMAVALIDQLTAEFSPEVHADQYRYALERVIEAKLGTPQAVTAPPPTPQGKVGDLMEALRASIEAAKRDKPVASDVAPPAELAESQPEEAPATAMQQAVVEAAAS